MKFGSTLNQKNLMASSGLFLCLYLVVHLAGNLQLLLPGEEAITQFNGYSKLLSGNYIIKAISLVLFAAFIAHSVYALILTLTNRVAKTGNYVFDKRADASKWYGRNMGVLGIIIFVFLIVHLKDFWYQYHFGTLPTDAKGNPNLYAVVVQAYGQWWYVLLSVAAFIALGYHLLHGFFSAFRTLGVYHPKFARWILGFGLFYSIGVTLGFIAIPVYIYLTKS